MTELRYALESFDQFFPDAFPLMQAHAVELEESLGVALELNVGLYKKLFDQGSLLLLTARSDGVMVGYQVIQIAHHIRAKGKKVAEEEALYLVPEFRRGFNGVNLLKLGIEAAKAVGAEIFYASSQECHPIGSLLRKVGFTKQAEIYRLALEG
jgi:hypothetical protein